MPRTSVVECPGCPPIRALTTDELGLIKVVESWGKPVGVPKVVERWGSPEAPRHVLLASMADHRHNPVMAIARKNGLIELLNPLNGEAFTSDRIAEAFPDNSLEQGSSLAALHLFKKRTFESGLSTILLCTGKGKACLRSVSVDSKDSTNAHTLKAWEACSTGDVLCSSVSGMEDHALFAGKGIEVNLWDLDTYSKIWTSKSPRANNLDIFSPTWFSASAFLCKEDHRKIVAGTNFNQVRVYDISAQRRPVITVDFRDSSIRSIAADPDECTVYIGTGKGDLASFDMRTGKLVGCFLGKCSGSIRSIARHPELPVIASCGLDRYLRFWDTKTRQLLSAVFLKQVLTNVMLDANFSNDVLGDKDSVPASSLPTSAYDIEVGDDEEFTRSVPSAKKSIKRKKKHKTPQESSDAMGDDEAEDNEEFNRSLPSVKKSKKGRRKKNQVTVLERSDAVEGDSGVDDMRAFRPRSPAQEGEHHRRSSKDKKRAETRGR